MYLRAIGLSVAGLLVAGGVIAGASGAQAEAPAPAADHPRAVDGTARTTQAVTGVEREQVASAIQRTDGSVTVHAVRRGADGTFHALGAKHGEPVLADVSRNYQRVTLQERPGA